VSQKLIKVTMIMGQLSLDQQLNEVFHSLSQAIGQCTILNCSTSCV